MEARDTWCFRQGLVYRRQYSELLLRQTVIAHTTKLSSRTQSTQAENSHGKPDHTLSCLRAWLPLSPTIQLQLWFCVGCSCEVYTLRATWTLRLLLFLTYGTALLSAVSLPLSSAHV